MEEDARQNRDVVVLIPAYNPDERLLALLHGLKGRFCRIVLVDDGSVTGHEALAAAAGLVETVLRHPVNRGKGAALKTGLRHVGACDVVTADADGQHRVEDIVRIAEALRGHRDGLVLGTRAFVGKVPFRSRFGNFCTRWLFFLLTGLRIRDTQTGLRGIPAALVPRVAAIAGDRFEYEMAMLADARRHPSAPLEVPIETVYMEGNASSNFRPLVDAIRIYGTLLQFCLSSVLGFVVDNAVYALVIWGLSGCDLRRKAYTFIALLVARTASSHFNYLYNRFVVFRSTRRAGGRHRSYWDYMGLVLAIGAASYVLTELAAACLDVRGVAITAVKIAVDAVLFFASYKIQKLFVFGRLK